MIAIQNSTPNQIQRTLNQIQFLDSHVLYIFFANFTTVPGMRNSCGATVPGMAWWSQPWRQNKPRCWRRPAEVTEIATVQWCVFFFINRFLWWFHQEWWYNGPISTGFYGDFSKEKRELHMVNDGIMDLFADGMFNGLARIARRGSWRIAELVYGTSN